MTHTENDAAPFQQCDKCEYKGTYTNLMRHKLNKHRENKIKCSLCPSEYYTKSNLNRHMDTSHETLSPHTCVICYKGFGRKDVLKEHIKSIHSNQRIFKNLCVCFVIKSSVMLALCGDIKKCTFHYN